MNPVLRDGSVPGRSMNHCVYSRPFPDWIQTKATGRRRRRCCDCLILLFANDLHYVRDGCFLPMHTHHYHINAVISEIYCNLLLFFYPIWPENCKTLSFSSLSRHGKLRCSFLWETHLVFEHLWWKTLRMWWYSKEIHLGCSRADVEADRCIMHISAHQIKRLAAVDDLCLAHRPILCCVVPLKNSFFSFFLEQIKIYHTNYWALEVMLSGFLSV